MAFSKAAEGAASLAVARAAAVRRRRALRWSGVMIRMPIADGEAVQAYPYSA
jgi:hypothetical protein